MARFVVLLFSESFSCAVHGGAIYIGSARNFGLRCTLESSSYYIADLCSFDSSSCWPRLPQVAASKAQNLTNVKQLGMCWLIRYVGIAKDGTRRQSYVQLDTGHREQPSQGIIPGLQGRVRGTGHDGMPWWHLACHLALVFSLRHANLVRAR